MDPPLEANGKAALSSILARSKLGEAKGSDFASGLPWTIVSRALSTALGLVPVVWIGDGLPLVPRLFGVVRDRRDRSHPGKPAGSAGDPLILLIFC
jgi:hypothetical protein